MKISNNALQLVAKWEGFRDKAYKCPAGVWTIGYGSTKWGNGAPVKQGDSITKEEAWELLRKQVQEHADTIEQYVKVKLSQNQYDALASFQYNLGKHILKDSYLLTYLNAKQWDKAANSMLQYNKARVNGVLTVLKGLDNRRKEEVALFNKVVPQATTSIKSTSFTSNKVLKVGSTVKLKEAKDYDKNPLNKSVLGHVYNVISITNNRVVIGKGKIVTAAVHKDNLIVQ